MKNSEMGRSNYFHFKQFSIFQQQSAMKVGTDGVLLGAWADVAGAASILDAGAGTGLIALMLAQRSPATIVAVEIDDEAYREACYNVSQSPWAGRIEVRHAAFQDFAAQATHQFDLVVSNPPFFENDLPAPNRQRSTARHNHLLPFDDLLAGTAKLLSPNGKLAVILPSQQSANFIQKAREQKLYLVRSTLVKANPAKTPHRCLLEFSSTPAPFREELLVIENARHHDYTEAYKQLTRDFYLAF